MSARIPDGSAERDAIEVAGQVAARTQRAAQDAKTENAQLRKRIDEVERLMVQIQVRLDALESLADVMIIDTPIPFEPTHLQAA